MSLTYYLIIGLFVWLIAISVLLARALSHYSRLTADVAKKDLVSSLNHLITLSKQNSDEIKDLNEKLNNEISENKKHLQKVGFKRYNPFTDTGGDQSFTAALLDDNGDGIMISSLHSRENTRLYAKKITVGQVENQVLSTEEKEVIKQALK